jgi:hypothetical protein
VDHGRVNLGGKFLYGDHLWHDQAGVDDDSALSLSGGQCGFDPAEVGWDSFFFLWYFFTDYADRDGRLYQVSKDGNDYHRLGHFNLLPDFADEIT